MQDRHIPVKDCACLFIYMVGNMGGIRWRSKAIRRMFGKIERPKEGVPCHVCGKNDYITELHHVIPIREIAKYINEFDVPLYKVKTPIVWLCPNCHSYLHAYDRISRSVIIQMAQFGYDRESIKRLIGLIELRDESITEILDLINFDEEDEK